MVRGLSASGGLQQQLDKYWKTDSNDDDGDDPGSTFSAGFVIGQRCRDQSSNWIVLHLAPTPNPEDDQEEEEEKQKSFPPKSVEQLDVSWMMEHHTQIVRMLPGGIDVIGVFFVTDEDHGKPGDVFNSPAASATIKKLARSIMQREQAQSLSEPGRDFEFAALQLSRPGQEVTARWVVDAGGSGNFKQAEFGVEQRQDPWLRVQGTFLLDLPVVFGVKEASRKGLLQEKVDAALAPLQKCIDAAHVIIDGSFRPQNDKLDPNYQDNRKNTTGGNKGGKGSKKKKRREEQEEEEQNEEFEGEFDEIKTFTAEILLDDETGEEEDCKVETICTRMRFSGKMHVCAFVPASATVGDAAAAIKCDVMRSLRGRFTMHCDSLVGDDLTGGSSDEDGAAAQEVHAPVVHEPPRRVMIQLPYSSNGVCVSDYLFPGETPYDSNDSVEEILGFKPAIEAFDDEIEMVAGPIQSRETLGSDSDADSRSPSRSAFDESSIPASSSLGPMVLLASLFFAAIAVLAGYYLLFRETGMVADENEEIIEMEGDDDTGEQL